jgi:hypothetical protein
LSILSLTSEATALLGQKLTIEFKSGNGSYLLATRSSPVSIVLDGADWPGVLRAANDLAKDFGRVTGVNGSVTANGKGIKSAETIFNVTRINRDWSVGAPGWNGTKPGQGSGTIIAGTIGNSSLIDALIKSGKLDVSDVEGQWEAYVSVVVKNPANGTEEALVIAGTAPNLAVKCILINNRKR